MRTFEFEQVRKTVSEWLAKGKQPNFYSAGTLGDQLYVIPFCLACISINNKSQLNCGRKFNLIVDGLLTRCKTDFDALNSLVAYKKLMDTQPYINCIVHQRFVDFKRIYNAVDTGSIRFGYVDMNKGDIVQRYNFIYRTLNHYATDDPWIILPKDDNFSYFNDKIIVFRTPRYHNKYIVNYKALQPYKQHVVFISNNENDYNYFKMVNFNCEFVKAQDFLQVGNIMNNCGFVVGNQTAYFAVAEAMKTPRLVEMSSTIPDVIPHGGTCNDFINNDDFKICLKLYADKFLG